MSHLQSHLLMKTTAGSAHQSRGASVEHVGHLWATCGPPVYLQAGDGDAASVLRQRGDGDGERRVGDVLIIKFDGNLIVTWKRHI